LSSAGYVVNHLQILFLSSIIDIKLLSYFHRWVHIPRREYRLCSRFILSAYLSKTPPTFIFTVSFALLSISIISRSFVASLLGFKGVQVLGCGLTTHHQWGKQPYFQPWVENLRPVQLHHTHIWRVWRTSNASILDTPSAIPIETFTDPAAVVLAMSQ
jgi:hypothetical protein